ncbi:HTH-type transcriptional regulator MgrA [Planctomycetales bacterium 10988]|nr:HTH-type transcriptional regulator MgrA [Planctomycetales bacterium 10988]
MAGKLEQQLKKKRSFDTPQQSVIVGLLRTNDLFQYRFGKLFREYGLTQPQYNVLRILRGEGKPLPCLEIASRLITMVPAITSLIDKLEKRSLVTRQRCNHDRRVWYIGITEAGLTLLSEMDEPVTALHNELCQGLSDEECRQLVELMEKARDGIAS